MEANAAVSAAHIALCVTCYKRDWQAKVALPINLIVSWPWRRFVTWYFVDFNEDTSLIEHIGKECAAAIEAGLLKVAKAEDKKWRHWHSSVAKNTSHMAAMAMYSGTLPMILVNVDCDNLITADWLADLAAKSSTMCPGPVLPNRDSGVALPGSGMTLPRISAVHYRRIGANGTTGRIAIPRSVFESVNGYDEDLCPAGYQHIDLVLRAGRMGTVVRVEADYVGNAVLNVDGKDKVNFRQSCEAKTANVDAAVIRRLQAETESSNISRQHSAPPIMWSLFNQENMRRSKAAMEAGRVRRNEGAAYLGCSWRFVEYGRPAAQPEQPELAACPQPLTAEAPAAPANPGKQDQEAGEAPVEQAEEGRVLEMRLPPGLVHPDQEEMSSNSEDVNLALVTENLVTETIPLPRFRVVTFGLETLGKCFPKSEAAKTLEAQLNGKPSTSVQCDLASAPGTWMAREH